MCLISRTRPNSHGVAITPPEPRHLHTGREHARLDPAATPSARARRESGTKGNG